METEQLADMSGKSSILTDAPISDLKEETLATIPKSMPVKRTKAGSIRKKEVMNTTESKIEETNNILENDPVNGREMRSLNDTSQDHGMAEELHGISRNDSISADEGLPKRQLTLRERAEKLMRRGSVKANAVLQPSEGMQEKALATKNIDKNSEQTDKLAENADNKAPKETSKAANQPALQSPHSPQSATSSTSNSSAKPTVEFRTTIPLKSGTLSPIAGSLVALDKDSDMPTASIRALNAETKSIFGRPSAATGYQKGRAALSGTAESKSIYGDLKGSPVDGPAGASYATMSTLRSTKTNNILQRNSSQISLGAAESPKTPVTSPKTFKEFYANLLRGITLFDHSA
jgi:hypothetical protein